MLKFHALKKSQRAFSLIEIMLGVTVIILVGLATVRTLQVFSKHQGKMDDNRQLYELCERVLINYKQMAPGAFAVMEWAPKVEITQGKFVVYGSVEPINQETRTRNVIITGHIVDGYGIFTATKTVEAKLSQMRGKVTGGSILVRVLNKADSSGLLGVKITAKGQDTPVVSAFTNDLGYATVNNVFLSATLSSHTVDGAYAFNPPGPCFWDDVGPPFVFTRSFTGAGVAAGEIRDLSGSPYYLSCSGVVTGTITFGTSAGAGIEGYPVRLINKAGSLAIPVTNIAMHTVTDANGVYKFTGVIPGQWGVYPLTVSTFPYPALSSEGDRNNVNWTGFITVATGSVNVVHFNSLPSASINSTVKYARNWSTGSKKFSNVTMDADNTQVTFIPSPARVYASGAPTGGLSMSLTHGWSNNVPVPALGAAYGNPRAKPITLTASSNGALITYPNFLPLIVHRDWTSFPLATQYGTFLYRVPYYQTVGIGTPIAIRNPTTPSSLVASVRVYDIAEETGIRIRPLSSSLPPLSEEAFKYRGYLGSPITDPFYIMHNNELAKITGVVKLSGSAFTSAGSIKIQADIAGSANVGGVRTLPGGEQYIDPLFNVPINTANGTYDTGRFVVPVFSATDNLILAYTESGVPSTFTADFISGSSWYSKVFVNNTIFVSTINPGSLSGYTLHFYQKDTNNLIFSQTANVSNTTFARGAINSFQQYNIYKATKTVHAEPGTTSTGDFDLANRETTYENYDVLVEPPSGDRWLFVWTEATKGPSYGINAAHNSYVQSRTDRCFTFNHVLNFKLKGAVTYATNIITGINILARPTLAHALTPNQSQVSTVDACAGSPPNMQYCFPLGKAIVKSYTNIVLYWSDPSLKYKDGQASVEVYDGADITYNIELILRSSGGGST